MENEKSNIAKDNTKIVLSDNLLNDAITKLLMKEKPIAISGFGYLEAKELSGKKTVLYKTADSNNPVMKDFYSGAIDMEFISLLKEKLSVPLKNGKTILLEEIGTFNPVKSSDGSLRLSFIPALSLKNKLNKVGNLKPQEKENKEEPLKTEPILPAVEKDIRNKEEILINKEQNNLKEPAKKEGIILSPSIEKREEAVKSMVLVKIDKKEIEIPKSTDKKEPNPNRGATTQTKEKERLTKKPSSVGRVLFDAESSKGKGEKKKTKKLLKWTILSVVFLIVVIVGINVFTEYEEDKQENIETTVTGNKNGVEAIDLLSLAEKNYGNPIFWVYIYEANQEKLKSPINIPKNIELVIPDLNINLNDTTEIKYAKMKAERILIDKK